MKIVAIGEITIDWLSLAPGLGIMEASRFYRSPGGNAANVAAGLGRLGLNPFLIARIGSDFHGQYLRSALEAENVDLSHLSVDPLLVTAQCYMTLDSNGEPAYRNWPVPHAAESLSPEHVPQALLKEASLLQFSGISLARDPRRATTLSVVELCKDTNCAISFDATMPLNASDDAIAAARFVLKNCHIAKFNLAELAYWSGLPLGSSIDEMVASVRRISGATVILVTLGKDGSFIYAADIKLKVPPMSVNCLSDVGAGDAYIAGFIYGLTTLGRGLNRALLKDVDDEEWLKVGWAGSVAGALVTRKEGAWESFPTRKEMGDCLEKQGAGGNPLPSAGAKSN